MFTEKNKTQIDRLFFIEFSILFLGKLQRKEVAEQFKISEAAATKDLSHYSKHNPELLEYDFRQKCYQFRDFKPIFKHSVDQSLFAISGVTAIGPTLEKTEAKVPIHVDSSIKRQVDIEIVATLTRSMRQNTSIKAVYSSMSTGERERRLSPLAIIHDGLRWHIRCYDHEKSKYQDYNLARFLSVVESNLEIAYLEADIDWNTWVPLELIVHPRATHPETISLDYDLSGSSRIIKIRLCLIGYFIRYWPIDYTDDATRDPRHYHLFLNNKSELVQQGVSDWTFG